MPYIKESILQKLIDAVTQLTERIDLLLNAPRPETMIPKEPIHESSPVKPEEPLIPIPQEYRETVNSILNKEFDIKINPVKDSPAFHFSILVPKKYSNAGEQHWRSNGCDERLKVISYADGILGIQEWIKKIYENLGPDIQTRIVADRTLV